MSSDVSDSWKVLCELHKMTRTVQSHAEFLKVDKVFIQPIKEERDAYDHIIKAMGRQLDGNDDDGYAVKQLKKAEGHAFRALYDSLDYLHMIVTERLVEELGRYNEYHILGEVEGYGRIRTRLIEIHKEFVDCKNRKDSVSIDSLQKAQEYYGLVLEYLDLYNELRLEVLPEFWKAEMSRSGTDRPRSPGRGTTNGPCSSLCLSFMWNFEIQPASSRRSIPRRFRFVPDEGIYGENLRSRYHRCSNGPFTHVQSTDGPEAPGFCVSFRLSFYAVFRLKTQSPSSSRPRSTQEPPPMSTGFSP